MRKNFATQRLCEQFSQQKGKLGKRLHLHYFLFIRFRRNIGVFFKEV